MTNAAATAEPKAKKEPVKLTEAQVLSRVQARLKHLPPHARVRVLAYLHDMARDEALELSQQRIASCTGSQESQAV